MSAASQIKRENHGAEVIVLEKSGDVSYAACGMPYNLFYKDKPVEELYALDLVTIRTKRGIFYFKTLDDTRLVKKIIFEKAPAVPAITH